MRQRGKDNLPPAGLREWVLALLPGNRTPAPHGVPVRRDYSAPRQDDSEDKLQAKAARAVGTVVLRDNSSLLQLQGLRKKLVGHPFVRGGHDVFNWSVAVQVPVSDGHRQLPPSGTASAGVGLAGVLHGFQVFAAGDSGIFVSACNSVARQ